jgi:putative oxidoreductase
MNQALTGYVPTLLRIGIAFLFIPSGIKKLLSPSNFANFLNQIGIPVPAFFTWIVLLSEILFGLAVLAGWNIKYAIWPLLIILIIAMIFVTIPSGDFSGIAFHLLAILVLISLFLVGAGKISL